MTDTSKLRAMLATPEGKQAYVAVIAAAQADGIAAYNSAIENGEKISEARAIGEAERDASLLRRMPIAMTAIARVKKGKRI